MTNPLRVLLADDHAMMRHGLRALIDSQPDMHVVAEANDGSSAIQQAQDVGPDVIVMDISMPEMNGLVATRMLKGLKPHVPIVILTRHHDGASVQALVRAGAAGYVYKQSAPVELLHAIRAVAVGGRYFDSTTSGRVLDGFPERNGEARRPRGVTITDRESDVLRLIAIGYSNKEIADRLGLSVKTVEAHKAKAVRKLGLKGRIAVVRYAVTQGWLYDT